MGLPETSGCELATGERLFLGLLLAAFGVFGGVVELRGAFLQHRYTDLAVYLRAAWAARTGRDVYATAEERGLHYHYPLLLAVLLMPLAEPPLGSGEVGHVPFGVSVGLWYCLSLGFLALGIHRLASALEERAAASGGPPARRGSRAWWALRVVPLLACLPPTAEALSLGQVTPLLTLLCCGAAAAVLRRRSFEAGAWVAGAVCLKFIPAFLLVYPLWRRDGRCLAGCGLGLALGFVAVPAVALGPAQAYAASREWVEVLVLPGLGLADGADRADELLNVTATKSQSPLAVLHYTLHLGEATPPPRAAAAVRLAHWGVGGALLLLIFAAAGRGTARDGPTEALFFGLLVLGMLMLSPVCHPHYLGLLLPLTMALWADARFPRPQVRRRRALRGLLAFNGVAAFLPYLPGAKVLHLLGLPMYAALAVGAAALVVLVRHRSAEDAEEPVLLRLADAGGASRDVPEASRLHARAA